MVYINKFYLFFNNFAFFFFDYITKKLKGEKKIAWWRDYESNMNGRPASKGMIKGLQVMGSYCYTNDYK